MAVGGHTKDCGVFQRPDQAATGFVPVLAPGDDFRKHGIVVGADDVTGAHAGIKPQSFAFGRSELVQGAGLRGETAGRVFGVKSYFDGVAIELDVILGQR